MVAAIGTKRRYFRHKTEDINCSNESYLHKLAKIVIKQKFDDLSNPFNIQLKGEYECNRKQQCKLYNEQNCTNLDMQPAIDLHKYYNLCEEEKGIEGYIADLLLTNTDASKNYTPILIEVKCKHKCTEDKINSNLKIIEVCIDSEKDIDWFKKNTWKDSGTIWEFDSELPQINFFNFNPKKQAKDFCDPQPDGSIFFNFYGTYQNRFVYYPSRKYYITERKCFELNKAYSDVSIVELNYPTHTSSLEIAHYLKRAMNIGLRACSICRYFWEDWYGSRHCGLKNKYETLESNDFFALDCSSFQLRWLSSLYKYLPEEQRLKDYQVEIIKK